MEESIGATSSCISGLAIRSRSHGWTPTRPQPLRPAETRAAAVQIRVSFMMFRYNERSNGMGISLLLGEQFGQFALGAVGLVGAEPDVGEAHGAVAVDVKTRRHAADLEALRQKCARIKHDREAGVQSVQELLGR